MRRKIKGQVAGKGLERAAQALECPLLPVRLPSMRTSLDKAGIFGGGEPYSEGHLAYLVWAPIIAFVDEVQATSVASKPLPLWSSHHQKCWTIVCEYLARLEWARYHRANRCGLSRELDGAHPLRVLTC